jgi:hypothetical protein
MNNSKLKSTMLKKELLNEEKIFEKILHSRKRSEPDKNLEDIKRLQNEIFADLEGLKMLNDFDEKKKFKPGSSGNYNLMDRMRVRDGASPGGRGNKEKLLNNSMHQRVSPYTNHSILGSDKGHPGSGGFTGVTTMQTRLLNTANDNLNKDYTGKIDKAGAKNVARTLCENDFLTEPYNQKLNLKPATVARGKSQNNSVDHGRLNRIVNQQKMENMDYRFSKNTQNLNFDKRRKTYDTGANAHQQYNSKLDTISNANKRVIKDLKKVTGNTSRDAEKTDIFCSNSQKSNHHYKHSRAGSLNDTLHPYSDHPYGYDNIYEKQSVSFQNNPNPYFNTYNSNHKYLEKCINFSDAKRVDKFEPYIAKPRKPNVTLRNSSAPQKNQQDTGLKVLTFTGNQ